jgi:hypothetical protein
MSTRRVLVSATAVVALIVGLLLLWYARDVLLLIFAGVLFGIGAVRRVAQTLARDARHRLLLGRRIVREGGLEDGKAALLVVIGATREGEKVVLAVESGQRESKESWGDRAA